MTKDATIEQVRAGVVGYGDLATLITVDDDGRPHVATALVDFVGERLEVGVGGRTRANLEQRPVATLVWQPPAGGEYLLIVDGGVDTIDALDDQGVSRVTLRVDGAIQHRLAGLPPGASTCRPPDALG